MDQTPTTTQPELTPVTTQTTAPVETQPVATPPPPPTPPIKTPNMKYVAVGGCVVIFLVLIFYMLNRRNSNETTPVPVATTPTPLATATPVQQVSAIATTSAFITFAENVASLSATVNAFSLQDGALSPPTLDLEIGFKKE